MKRPQQHVMEDESQALVGALLPREWIIRPLPKDYGVDLEIELVDQGVVTGNRIWVQLKSARHVDGASVSFPVGNRFTELTVDSQGNLNVQYIPYSIETKEVQYSLHCPFPLLLFLADLNEQDVLWLPIRDEVMVNLSRNNPNWGHQNTTTLRIPTWNRLSLEKQANYSGLRWYAMEPARMYAFAVLHYFHHEFNHRGRLSGYEIGDGWIDHGEEPELRHSLRLAQSFLELALDLDVLFGNRGVDYYQLESIHGAGFPGIGLQLQEGLSAIPTAIERLDSQSYSLVDMSLLLGRVAHAMDVLSTAIASYQCLRGKHLLTEATAVWHAAAHIHGLQGAPVIPMSRRPHWPAPEEGA